MGFSFVALRLRFSTDLPWYKGNETLFSSILRDKKTQKNTSRRKKSLKKFLLVVFDTADGLDSAKSFSSIRQFMGGDPKIQCGPILPSFA